MAVAGSLVLVSAPPALARSFELPEARVVVEVQPDGSLVVVEHITFAFDGSFRGAYREIPMRAGESIVDLRVSEGGRSYRPGAPTDLGSEGDPGTYGVVDLGNRMRVVWHYRASDEARVFTIGYRMLGVAKAYDDVVDVNLQVWGDQWEQPLGRLFASASLPGGPPAGEVRVFGHPASVGGTVSLGRDGVSPDLVAYRVPSRQFVEMRFLFPRALLVSAAGAQVIEGPGLDRILAEEAAQARRAAEEREAFARLRSRWPWFLLLAFLPALLAVLAIYLAAGREPRVSYEREYEQEPPSEHPPALVGTLGNQRQRVGTKEFTATLFDLIRRRALTAHPVTRTRSTWGGLRTEQISDLEIGIGEPIELSAHEKPVMDVARRVLSDGPQSLSEFRHRIRDDAEANRSSYLAFREQVRKAIKKERLFEQSRVGLVVMVALFFLATTVLAVVFAVRSLTQSDGSLVQGVLLLVLAAASLVNLLLVLIFAAWRTGWVRRTPAGALLASRWGAFRRYLSDFSRLEEAPPASLALWEQYLVYGIALGVAEDVLEAARLHAPPVVQESSLYWFGTDGYGGGLTGNAIHGIEQSLARALAPPSSGSGFGGGFSGGGGGGSGGGGGGAW